MTPNDKNPVRFILVEGPPGIGKSTFAWEVCRRWDEIEILKNYHAVVLLKLREKWVINAVSLSDLFRYPFQPNLSHSIAQSLHNSQGKHLLLVLDGFDELSHGFHKNSVIKSILCRQLLPECTNILTTRPVAMYTLRIICQPEIDKHIEIIGFTEEERVRYITEVFSKEPELQVNFLKYMFLVPHIKSMMYIPLNCAIIAQVYYESQSSHHLAIPRTRTQLYKALTNSLLIRHMRAKENNQEAMAMLPEGLDDDNMERFKVLAKFAFDSYHEDKSRKFTFFKEDIPEGLIHFGFMNESMEMYAGKGVEKTFSFLHLSLQEYLAAWHVASTCSTEFQVAYHGMAVKRQEFPKYRGDKKEEQWLCLGLSSERYSLVEPAMFLAGITGWKSQSESDRNVWEIYLTQNTLGLGDSNILLCSLYEAQNLSLLTHYFKTENREMPRHHFNIGSDLQQLYAGPSIAYDDGPRTPYDCYAVAYCLANTSNQFCFNILFHLVDDFDISLVETFCKGLKDHLKLTTPRIKHLVVESNVNSLEASNRCLIWLTKARIFESIDELNFKFFIISGVIAHDFLALLNKLKSLQISIHFPASVEWLAAIPFLSDLKELHLSVGWQFTFSPTDDVHCCPEHRVPEIVHDRKSPLNTYDDHSETAAPFNSIVRAVLNSYHVTKVVLFRETMAGVCSILQHCSNLMTLKIKRTRLGYDGILYICSVLTENRKLKFLLIHDDLKLPICQNRDKYFHSTSFLSMERAPLPSKISCTDFILELNEILKNNTTLEEINIQSGLFLPLSVSADEEYCQWTGLAPLQQFNVGAVGSGIGRNLKRSFSSSDLTQPQTTLFWGRAYFYRPWNTTIDFKEHFSEKRKRLMSLPSFTAPDSEVLPSFSGLDPRLKKCLGISDLHPYVEGLRNTFQGMLTAITLC